MKDFTQGNITKHLLLFALPMLIGSVFQQFYSLADAIIVGRFVGGGALAAVGIANITFWFLTSLVIGLTTGSSIVISQLYGGKEIERMKRATATTIVFMLIFSAIISVLGVLFSPAILRLLNVPQDIMAETQLYMQIIFGGMIFNTFYNMFTAYLRALGEVKNPLFILIFTCILNVGLNFVVVVHMGLGVGGAAVTTVMSQGVAMVLTILYIRFKVPLLHVKKLLVDKSLLFAILKNGLPAALQMSFISISSLTITRLINSFGTAAIAGLFAVQRIDHLAIIPVATLSMALSVFVGQNIGAFKEDRCKQGLKIAMLQSVSLAVLMSVVMMIFSRNLVALFIDAEDAHVTEIITIGQNYLNIMVIFYFLFAIQFTFNGFLRGVGDAFSATFISLGNLILRVKCAYFLVYFAGMGPEAIAWSLPFGWLFSCTVGFIYYKKGFWKGKMVT